MQINSAVFCNSFTHYRQIVSTNNFWCSSYVHRRYAELRRNQTNTNTARVICIFAIILQYYICKIIAKMRITLLSQLMSHGVMVILVVMWLWTVTKTTTRPLYRSARRAQIIQRSISRQLAVLLRLLQTVQLVMRRRHTEHLRTGVGHRRPAVVWVSCVAKSTGVRQTGTARLECPVDVRVPPSVNRKRRQRRWRLSFHCRSPVPLSTTSRTRSRPNSSPFVPTWPHRLRARPESASVSVWIRSRRNSRTWKVADRWAAMAIISTKAGQQHPMWRSLKRVSRRNPVSRLPLPSAV